MSSLRKLKSGFWQVAIRRKDQPVIYSGASATTLKDLICKYRDEIVPEQKAHRQTT